MCPYNSSTCACLVLEIRLDLFCGWLKVHPKAVCVCVCFRIFIEVPEEDVVCVHVVTWDCADVVDDGLSSCSGFCIVGCWSIDSSNGDRY